MFTPMPNQVDLPALEHEVLRRWRESKVFERSLPASKAGRNGRSTGPADRQRHARHPPRRGAGLQGSVPAVQDHEGLSTSPAKPAGTATACRSNWPSRRSSGFNGKKDIEAYGIAEFNARCRASVERHVDEFEKLTERMGYWVDMSKAYRTMDASYIESVWWSLKAVFDKGLLVSGLPGRAVLPALRHALSDHEVAQGYLDVTDPSVYVRFPVTSGPFAGQADLLVWTTTPWTLVSATPRSRSIPTSSTTSSACRPPMTRRPTGW